MKTGTFLLLILAMGALSLLLAVMLVAMIVPVVGWLVRLSLAFRGPKQSGPVTQTADGRGWFEPMTEHAPGVKGIDQLSAGH